MHKCIIHRVLGVLNRCNYYENRPKLDSNQQLLLATLVCYALYQLVLSSRTWASLMTHSDVLSCSLRLRFSSQVSVEQVEHILCTIYIKFSPLNLPIHPALFLFRYTIESQNQTNIIKVSIIPRRTLILPMVWLDDLMGRIKRNLTILHRTGSELINR